MHVARSDLNNVIGRATRSRTAHETLWANLTACAAIPRRSIQIRFTVTIYVTVSERRRTLTNSATLTATYCDCVIDRKPAASAAAAATNNGDHKTNNDLLTKPATSLIHHSPHL